MEKNPWSKVCFGNGHTLVSNLMVVSALILVMLGLKKSLNYNFSLYKTTQDETDYTVVSLNRTATDLVAKKYFVISDKTYKL